MPTSFDNQIDTNFYKSLLENIDEAVYFVDTSRQILFWNKKAEELTGYLQKDVMSTRCQDNLLDHVDAEGNHICGHKCPLVQAILTKDRIESSLFLHHKEGHRLPVNIRSMPIQNQEGMVLGAVEIFSTDAKTSCDEDKVKELAKLAYLDPESKLPNKNYIQMKWEGLHTELNSAGIEYGIIFLDISNYKDVVSQMGYEVSINIISTVSQTIHALGLSQHIVGRWSETAFVILLPSASTEMTQQFAKRYSRVTRQSSFHYQKKHVGIQSVVKCYSPPYSQTRKDAVETIMRLPYINL